jgi:hypothetical protein
MKYKLTHQSMKHDGVPLYRIEAIASFGNVKAGERGGWVQNTRNLAKRGLAWIADEAVAYGKARISGNARLEGNASVHDAFVYDDAKVSGNATVEDGATVRDHGRVSGSARMLENSSVTGYAHLRGDIVLQGESTYHTDPPDLGPTFPSDQEELPRSGSLWGWV